MIQIYKDKFIEDFDRKTDDILIGSYEVDDCGEGYFDSPSNYESLLDELNYMIPTEVKSMEELSEIQNRIDSLTVEFEIPEGYSEFRLILNEVESFKDVIRMNLKNYID